MKYSYKLWKIHDYRISLGSSYKKGIRKANKIIHSRIIVDILNKKLDI